MICCRTQLRLTRRALPTRSAILAVFLLGVTILGRETVQAEEPANAFLGSLLELKYYDLAEYYLDQQGAKDLLSPEFRAKINYERAIVLMRSARLIGNGDERNKQFEVAEKLLVNFSQESQDSELKILANNELGNLLFQRANLILFEASQDENKTVRGDMLERARLLLQRAREIYVAGRAQLKKELEAIPKILDPKKQQPQIERRKSLYANYLQVRITATKLLEEIGKTYDPGTPEHMEAFKLALPEYDEIAKTYRNNGAGMLALVAQGRCYLAINDTKQAVSYLRQVVDQRGTPGFRGIVTRAMPLYIEVLSHESVNQIEQALTIGIEWNADIRPNETYNSEWHAFQLELARAYIQKAKVLEKETPENPGARKAYVAALKLAQQVLKYPGQYKSVARDLIASLPALPGAAEEQKVPETFAEALALGKEYMEAAQTMNFTIKSLPARIKAETDEANKKVLETQLREAQENYKPTQDAAVLNYEMVLTFTDADTPVEQLQEVYYYLTFINYSRAQYYEAAVLGEYLARRYPGTNAARPCAKIALNCYQILYNNASPGDREFEVRRLIDIAQYTIRNWETSAEATDARRRLVPYMIEANRFDEARDITLDIPEGAAERLESELRLGRAMWLRYRQSTAEEQKLKENQSNPARLVELATEIPELLAVAAEMLIAGTDHLAASPKTARITASSLNGLLSACQYYSQNNEVAKAITHLEAADYGLLTLIRNENPAASSSSLAEQSFRIGLSSHIAMLGFAAEKAPAHIDAAKKIMAELNELVGETPDGQKRLVRIYFTLARELVAQLKSVSDDAQRQVLADGFETFVNEVSKTSEQFTIQHWIGATMQSLGNGFEDNGAMTPQAKAYYEKAIEQFTKIKAKGKADPTWVHEDPATAKAYVGSIRMNLAQVMKKLGDYKAASTELAYILLSTPSNVSVQIEAARTYSELGKKEKDADKYLLAIGGARKMKNGDNLIWGWRKINRLTLGKDAFKDEYYESRLGIAEARLGYAMLKTGEDKKKYLGYAELEVLNTKKIYPELGGPEIMAQFDTLLKQIRKALAAN
jgi:hypothetical protein